VCIVVLPISELEEVASGSRQELGLLLVSSLISVIKYLKCHFHKISLGGLKAILCLFKFSLDIREILGNKMGVENKYSGLGFLSASQKVSGVFSWDAG
jgi:hypothetical protein